jgi:glucan phosphoethanolaminetransferase (alkaline phosphatase superfamily)
MIKSLKKQIDGNIVELAALLALLFCLLFNTPVILNKYSLYKATFFKALLELSKDFIIIYAVVFLLFVGLSIRKSVLYGGTFILYLSGAFASYYVYNFNLPISRENVRAAFENDIGEIYEVMSLKLALWVIFSVFIGLYTIFHYKYKETKFYLSKILIVGCFILSIYNIASPQYRIFTAYFPYKYLNSTYLYIEGKIKKKSNRLDISELEYKSQAPDDLNIVVIIGESARADHFSLNGYERNTNPRLKEVSNLFSFEARSCSCMTYLSVPCMLTRATSVKPEAALEETTFISVFKKIGFKTSWLATQSILKYLKGYTTNTLYDESDFLLLPGGSALFQMNAHDETLLPYFDEVLAKGDKNLIVLHTSGSHWNYEFRYPENFAIFKPGCADQLINKRDPSTCSAQGLINAYDNSIIYTDNFIAEIIERLKDKNAIIFYASDHGQFLGEHGKFMHGNLEATEPEQYNIPLMVWVSDSFKSKNKEFYANIATYRNSKLNHDYIFHSVLDCSGVESEIIDKNLSLCRARQ